MEQFLKEDEFYPYCLVNDMKSETLSESQEQVLISGVLISGVYCTYTVVLQVRSTCICGRDK